MAPEIRQFVDILPEPSFLISGRGRISFANSAAAELLLTERRVLAGADLQAFLSDAPEKFLDYLRLCARTRQLIPGAFRFRHSTSDRDIRCDAATLIPGTPDSEPVIFLRCRPKAEATDHFVLLNRKIAALAKEIVERKKAEQQRDELLVGERAARIEAERISRMKDEFLATLSHELRTPLSAILGWVDVLTEEGLPPSIAEGVEVISRNASAQKQLIEDLLDMNRIISGKIRLDVQRVDLATVISAATVGVRPAAEAKQIRLQVTLDPLAGPVRGDPGRLQQVVWNLLSNAVKFTPKGGRVQVVLERVNSHLEITVADTGEGIKPEFLPHLFERFHQADSSTTRRHGGLGIGLSIAKQLIELHGGSIRAKSPGPGQGATFIVMVPLLPLQESEPAEENRTHPHRVSVGPERSSAPQLTGIAVLVVDDERDARDLLRKVLTRQHATVRTAASAAEALEFISTAPPDLIVSDIGMPDVDGYDFMRQLRSMPPELGGRIPAIALTAFARSEDRMRAMLAGYNLHLSKPVEPTELLVAIGSLTGALPRHTSG